MRNSTDTQARSVIALSKQTGYPVVREANPILVLVDENRHGRVGTGIRHILNHLLHDERIADNETQALWCLRSARIAQDFAQIEAGKLHQS